MFAAAAACQHHEAESPSAAPGDAVWSVSWVDGKCAATPVVPCEHTSPCNPVPYDCPAGVPTSGADLTLTRRAGKGTCTLETSPKRVTMDAPCPK